MSKIKYYYNLVNKDSEFLIKEYSINYWDSIIKTILSKQ